MSENVPMTSLFGVVKERASRQEVAVRIQKQGQDAYEIRVMRALMTMRATYEELWHLLSLLRKADQLQEISALLKLYVTSWSTLSDVVAILINEIYDLGYAEHDVQLNAILRNRHIRQTSLAETISRHRKTIEHERYAKMRNDVVHRGRLDDADLQELIGQWLSIALHHACMSEATSDETRGIALAAAAAKMGLDEKRRQFIDRRATSLAAHLRATLVLLNDVGDILAERMQCQPAA